MNWATVSTTAGTPALASVGPKEGPCAGSPGTRRIPMNRVAGLVLAGLVLLLNVTLTQAQAMCPVDGTEPSVPCDFTGTDNCFHHCCQTSGVCPSFSCISSFDALTDEGTACTGKCRREIECVPFNSACLDDVNNPVCFGTVVCKTLDCAGRTAGDICLISGRKIKICGPLDDGGPVFRAYRSAAIGATTTTTPASTATTSSAPARSTTTSRASRPVSPATTATR